MGRETHESPGRGLATRNMSVILDSMIASLTPQQAQDLIARGEVEVVDVRDPEEWCGGHIDGARLVPLNQLRANPKGELQQDGVVFVCAAGVRSQTAARIAASQGLARVYNLTGGTRAWVKAGLPLVNDIRVAV
jgi:rhodanese-related sulfurtransferase